MDRGLTKIERLRSDLAFLRNYYASIGNIELSDKYQRRLDSNPLY